MATLSLTVEDIDLSLEKDLVIGCFIIHIKRERLTKTHKIGLQLTHVQKLIDMSGEINEIATKYGDGSVSIEKLYHVEGEIYLKVRTYGATVQIDIRRYCFIENEQIPLKAGVTVPGTYFNSFILGLTELVEEAQSM